MTVIFLPEPGTCSNQCHMVWCPPYSPSSCVCMCSGLHEKLNGEAQISTLQSLFAFSDQDHIKKTELRLTVKEAVVFKAASTEECMEGVKALLSLD